MALPLCWSTGVDMAEAIGMTIATNTSVGGGSRRTGTWRTTSVAYRIEQAQAQFDAWSASYDRSWLQAAFFRPSHRLIFRHLSQVRGRLLDIGCGTGLFLAEVLHRHPGLEVVGLDLSQAMLDHAAQRCRDWPQRAWVVRGDSQRLPFQDDSFDVVTCSHSFHHYPDQRRVVGEMHRVLRPGGQLLLIDGDRDRPLGWFIFDVCVTWKEGDVRHCSARRLRALFHQAGFTAVKQYRRRLPIPFLLTIGMAAKSADGRCEQIRAA